MDQSHPTSIEQLITPAEAARMLGYKWRTAVWRLVRQGVLPQPIRITTAKVGWRRSTLETFIAEREKAAA